MSIKIATALHEVMSKVAHVQKTGKNSFHGYKYAGEADLLGVLRPAMVEAGLMLLPSVKTVSPVDEFGNVTVQMEYSLVHRDGDVWPDKLGAAGMGNDKAKNGSVGDKGVYKAITGANKYVLFKLFQIETGDDPEQFEHHDVPATPAPKKQTGYRDDGTRTSFALKKEQPDLMKDLDRELDECKTLVSLEKLKSAYREKAAVEKWNKSFMNTMKEMFDRREAAIMNEMERLAEAPDEELSRVPAREQFEHSIHSPGDFDRAPFNPLGAG